MKHSNIRSQRGVSGLVIVMVTAFMIILPLGLFGYEFLRFSLVQQELRSVCEAAGLAGAVGIATSGGLGYTPWKQDQSAMAAAYNAFCENMITDCTFVAVGNGTANVNADAASNYQQNSYFNPNPETMWTGANAPPVHTAKVNFILLDENKNQTNWSSAYSGTQDQPGLISAASLRVDAFYGYSLPILGAMGLPPVVMTATSTGGLPQLDVILCFDLSGSMDDFTNVTVVNRYWVTVQQLLNSSDTSLKAAGSYLQTNIPGCNGNENNYGVVEYDVPPSFSTYGADSVNSPPFWTQGSNGSAQGPLYYVVGCYQQQNSWNGCVANVQPPMNLNQMIDPPQRYAFMAQLRNGQATPNNYPGNYPGGGVTTGAFPMKDPSGIYEFTDLVVNMPLNASPGTVSGNDAQWPIGQVASYSGITFNDVAYAVEASRGNLDSSSAFQTAVNPAKTASPAYDNQFYYIVNFVSAGGGSNAQVQQWSSTSGQPGASGAYWMFVQQNTHPLADSVKAAQQFFQFLYNSADCHFGLICFSDGIGNQTAGTPPTDTWADGWESPPGSTHINMWTTAATGGAGGSPPTSAMVSGNYTGPGATNPNDSDDPWNGIDQYGLVVNGVQQQNGTFLLPLVELNNGQAYSASGSSYINYGISGTDLSAMSANPLVGTGDGKPGDGNGLVATGSTDVTDALQEAVTELMSTKARPNATKAIVLFTDGAADLDKNATSGNAGTNFSTCLSDCQSVAAQAGTNNITIFSIGLAMDNQNAGLANLQQQLLSGITNSANASGGGNSTWQQITQASLIQQTFQSIAKNLVVITK